MPGGEAGWAGIPAGGPPQVPHPTLEAGEEPPSHSEELRRLVPEAAAEPLRLVCYLQRPWAPLLWGAPRPSVAGTHTAPGPGHRDTCCTNSEPQHRELGRQAVCFGPSGGLLTSPPRIRTPGSGLGGGQGTEGRHPRGQRGLPQPQGRTGEPTVANAALWPVRMPGPPCVSSGASPPCLLQTPAPRKPPSESPKAAEGPREACRPRVPCSGWA